MKTQGLPIVAADVSRRRLRCRNSAPTDVGGYARRAGCPRDVPFAHGTRQHGYLLIEALVYIAVVLVLLGVGYAAMYRCVDRSLALRRNADDITTVLHVGERWRADIRAATSTPQLISTNSMQLLQLESARGPVTYRFYTNSIARRVGEGAWVRLLPTVKFSNMTADPREHITAWRWELELQTRANGSAKPGRIRPLFTFLAVPESATPK